MEQTERNKIKQRNIAIRRLLQVLALLVIAAVWWVGLRPISLNRQLDAVCRVEAVMCYALPLENGDTLHISVRDRRLTDDNGDPVRPDTVRQNGMFVSGVGHVVTSTALFRGAPDSIADDSLRTLLWVERQRLAVLSAQKAEAVKELDYYARTHTVTDDGYNEVMTYKDATDRQSHLVDSLLALVTAVLEKGESALEARLCYSLNVTATVPVVLADGITPTQTRTCQSAAVRLARRADLLLLQTLNSDLPPSGTYFQLWHTDVAPAGRLLLASLTDSMLPDALPLDSAFFLSPSHVEGGAVTDRRGQLLALRTASRDVPLSEVRTLCTDVVGGLQWWTQNARVALKRIFLPPSDDNAAAPDSVAHSSRNVSRRHHLGDFYATYHTADSAYCGRVVDGLPEGFGTMTYADGASFTGLWRAGRREGYGELCDSLGRRISGIWQADTLSSGRLVNDTTVYEGDLDLQFRPHGEGCYRDSEGTYYQGEWTQGRRHGFGFAVGDNKMVRAGIWKNDAFVGEQMIYTADRVYGIDISRYQHEIGRRKYSIEWSKVRITKLGAANATRVRGQQDYPVSFVYIKASQGTTIRNRYYATDVAACRKRGIHVGAYHFFSTKRDGLAQAKYFMKMAAPRTGDLPPVLDVEPSDAQIKAMGGSAAMFREIIKWMRYVRQQCGTDPVLYVSQSFVNKYMSHAPEELSRYQVWIARYGEYKPYVHLLYWQLSPRGRVAGIKGDVDINVYNGNKEDFRQYVSTHGVKR